MNKPKPKISTFIFNLNFQYESEFLGFVEALVGVFALFSNGQVFLYRYIFLAVFADFFLHLFNIEINFSLLHLASSVITQGYQNVFMDV